MATIVQKFGGTSVATLDLIKKAATRVKAEVEAGHSVVVVVSAMAGVTNALIEYVRDLSTTYDRAEYDAVLSSGEQVSAALLALSLQNTGVSARSWLGWQIPIHTTSHHTQAKIERIETEGLLKDLQAGHVAVVAGFQGLSPEGRITTLGRGGSDATAVALAAALHAERCDIYTDVDGVYTADPRYVTTAGKLNHIAYQEMLELAALGAKVLQKESVELAMRHRIPLRVLSSLSESPGTLVTGEPELNAKKKHIRGLAHTLNEAKLTLCALPFAPSLIDEIKALLTSHHIAIDMMHHTLSLTKTPLSSLRARRSFSEGVRGNPSNIKPLGSPRPFPRFRGDGLVMTQSGCIESPYLMDCSFTILATEAERVKDILEKFQNDFHFNNLLIDYGVAKISVIGSGLQTELGPSHRLFQTLRQKEIEVQAVSASDIKLSVLVPACDAARAILSLHTLYQLDVEEGS